MVRNHEALSNALFITLAAEQGKDNIAGAFSPASPGSPSSSLL
jgi:hypothetical protein